MMSKMTPSFKSPVRNPQCPPSPKFRPDLNHVGSSSNFQDIFLIIYWHDLWCQRWPHPPSLQSGTLNILQVPNEASQLNHDGSPWNFQDIFLIIYQHHLWCQRWPHPSSLQSGTINIIQAPMWSKTNFKPIFSLAKLVSFFFSHFLQMAHFSVSQYRSCLFLWFSSPKTIVQYLHWSNCWYSISVELQNYLLTMFVIRQITYFLPKRKYC